MKKTYTALAIFFAIGMMPLPAWAYIGPGLGVALVWSLLGPVAALVTLVLIAGYYPARYFYKKYKKSKTPEQNAKQNADESKPETKSGETKK